MTRLPPSTHCHTHSPCSLGVAVLCVGEWRDDMKWGVGMMQYDNGDVYEGDWECDVRCGHGTMKWQALRQQYEGYWARGLPHGVGTHIWLQQLVTEPTPTNHAMLLMFNRWALPHHTPHTPLASALHGRD